MWSSIPARHLAVLTVLSACFMLDDAGIDVEAASYQSLAPPASHQPFVRHAVVPPGRRQPGKKRPFMLASSVNEPPLVDPAKLTPSSSPLVCAERETAKWYYVNGRGILQQERREQRLVVVCVRARWLNSSLPLLAIQCAHTRGDRTHNQNPTLIKSTNGWMDGWMNENCLLQTDPILLKWRKPSACCAVRSG